VSGRRTAAKEFAMNLLRKSAIVAAAAALVALASEAAPAVIALVAGYDGGTATSPRLASDAFTKDPATSGFGPASVSLTSLFDASWR
jgi:hypothetical protein